MIELKKRRFACEFGHDGYYIIDRNKIHDYDDEVTDEDEYRAYMIERSLKGHEVIRILNELYKSKEYWKTECIDAKGEIQVLHNEIKRAMEKGYELSYGYKSYMERKKRYLNE